MEEVIVIVHLLAAAVWLGGSVALVFAGVPAIRMLDGEPRGRAMKELGLRWRPIGYGSLLVLALTGVELARHDWSEGRSPFQTVLWVKVGALGVPRRRLLPAQLRARAAPAGRDPGRPRRRRRDRRLVVVGWTSLALTVTVPILGAILANLAG